MSIQAEIRFWGALTISSIYAATANSGNMKDHAIFGGTMGYGCLSSTVFSKEEVNE